MAKTWYPVIDYSSCAECGAGKCGSTAENELCNKRMADCLKSGR